MLALHRSPDAEHESPTVPSGLDDGMRVSVMENAAELKTELQAILGLRAASCRCPHLEIRNPQSAICNPQSAIRNPQSAIRNSSPDISTPTLEIHCQIKEFCHPAPE